MAALEQILSQARRHCCRNQTSKLSLLLSRSYSSSVAGDLGHCKSLLNSTSRSSFLGFHRFCSSSTSASSDAAGNEEPVKSPPPPPPTTTPQTPSIKPVSYAVKPKDPAEEELTEKPRSRELRRPREASLGLEESEIESKEGTNAAEESKAWTREDIRYVKDVPSISPVSYPSRVANLPEDRVSAQPEEAAPKEEDKKENDEQLAQERRRIDTNFRLRRTLRVEDEVVLPFPTLVKAEKRKQKTLLDLQEAIKEVKANAKRNFVETVEAHVNLGVDTRKMTVRGAVTLPHGTGKTVKVAVFAEGEAAEEARAAGAEIVGGEDLIDQIKNGSVKLDFDKCIATPILMPRLGKIAKMLGPRGLMPNPKFGSVTTDVAGAVKDAKCGRVDFRIDKTSIVHAGIGKVTLSDESLRENISAFVNALVLAKPVGLKKTSKYAGYMLSFTLCSTMGPGFPVSLQSVSSVAESYGKMKVK